MPKHYEIPFRQKISLGLVVLVIAGVGTYLLNSTRAATPYASINVAKGVLAGAATIQTDPATSDGKYVQFGGRDECTTTISPGASVTSALTALKPSDVLCLHGGIYTEDINVNLTAGTAALPITVKAYPGERPVIQGLFWAQNASYWTFNGINVTWNSATDGPSDHMVKLTNGVGWTWENSEVWGAHSYADMLVAGTVSGQPADWRITNSCLHDTYPTNSTNQDHNLYVNTGTSAGAGRIDHTILFNATNGENIKLAGGDSSEGTANVTVDHDTLYNASQNLLVGWTSQNNTIAKNIFDLAGSTYGNIRGFELTGTNNVAADNLGYQASSLILNYDGGLGVTDGGDNVSSINPEFDTMTCGGFHPQNTVVQAYGVYAP